MVFDISRYMIEDGPGIRTNVFFKGCPLRCVWCSNPFGLSPRQEVAYNHRKCTLCGACVGVCPENACSIEGDRVVTDRQRCTACGKCAGACLTHARVIVGTEYSPLEIVERVNEDATFYRRGGGGVTLSGGEVLMQADAALEVLRLARGLMLHTAIETSAHAQWERLELLLPYCDIVFVDLKHVDSERHRCLTGWSNELILENIRRLVDYSASHASPVVVLRLPVIPGLNDDESTMSETARFIASLRTAIAVNILPYHNLGITKYEMVGLESTIDGDLDADAAGLQRYCDHIRALAANAVCSIGGGEIDYDRLPKSSKA
ncbi:MAG: glycyl-radical enzyme activating protein [Thermoleophilia bacterium]|nr:glycyl-radical enzyme activating protein [Thermoleophilia bacterium]